MTTETTRVVLWEIKASAGAIHFALLDDPNARKIWIPRSVINHISREPKAKSKYQKCIVDLDLWFAEREAL